MKALIRWGLAAALVVATAMPAMAEQTIDVCAATANIKEDSTATFFSAWALFFPEGTITDGVKNCPTTGESGAFYTNGSFLAPNPGGFAAFATWGFIFNKGGRFITVGIVNQKTDFFQTITGGHGGFANSGRILVHNFSVTAGGTAAFAFSVTHP